MLYDRDVIDTWVVARQSWLRRFADSFYVLTETAYNSVMFHLYGCYVSYRVINYQFYSVISFMLAVKTHARENSKIYNVEVQE